MSNAQDQLQLTWENRIARNTHELKRKGVFSPGDVDSFIEPLLRSFAEPLNFSMQSNFGAYDALCEAIENRFTSTRVDAKDITFSKNPLTASEEAGENELIAHYRKRRG